jgi:hypothetical protein
LHAGTPIHVNIFRYFYNIGTGMLTEVVKDKAEVDFVVAVVHAGGAVTQGTHAMKSL